MSKPQIPAISIKDLALNSILRAMKENIEVITGVRTNRISKLPDSASNTDIISKINEIIDRLNA